jgi:hypothetical protein
VREVTARSAAVRQRRAEATRRWRERLDRGAAVYPVEVDGETFALMERLRLLQGADATSRARTALALGKLLRRALAALKRELDARPDNFA